MFLKCIIFFRLERKICCKFEEFWSAWTVFVEGIDRDDGGDYGLVFDDGVFDFSVGDSISFCFFYFSLMGIYFSDFYVASSDF